MSRRTLRQFLTIGLGLKRWGLASLLGLVLIACGSAIVGLHLFNATSVIAALNQVHWLVGVLMLVAGIGLLVLAFISVAQRLLAPYTRIQRGSVMDAVVEHSRRGKGLRFVAIGGGTGLPNTLRGMKAYTTNITAIVTVADSGGSSGRLRRDLGVLPPGDLRNNIVALADDESLMTRLFQYRFEAGDLSGHAFGNLFIAALASVVGEEGNNNLAEALTEIERVLNIQGRVLPSTLDDVQLVASIKTPGLNKLVRVIGEAQFEAVEGGAMEVVELDRAAAAYPESLEAIRNAEIIALGPGSLFTSIIPNLLVTGIVEALRESHAYKIYVCNVATQPVETEGFDVADHVLALERHVGRGVFQAVVANNHYPSEKAGGNTRYVRETRPPHEILQRYKVRYTDLTDSERPWRHDPQKLARAILEVSQAEVAGAASALKFLAL